MPGKLERLTKKLYNTPHLIDEPTYSEVLKYLESRNSSDVKLAIDTNKARGGTEKGQLVENGYANLVIEGPLTYKSTGWEALCGGTSYQSILSDAELAIEQGAHTLILDIDSGGGEAYGMFETGKELRQLADDNNVTIYAYVDGMAASAAYGLSAIADKLIINPQAKAGSIGVVVQLWDESKAIKNAGYKRLFVYAGDNKIPYAEDGSFRKEFLDEIQKDVDELYTEFTQYVADMRGLDVQAVIDTQAGMFSADEAIELGLVDSKMTREQFYNFLADNNNEGRDMPLSGFSNKIKTEEIMAKETRPEIDMTDKTQEEMQKKLKELEAKLVSQIQAATLLQGELDSKVQAEKEAIMAKLEEGAAKWEFAGVDAKAYAEAAIGGSVPVNMFDEAMAKASESLSEKDSAISTMKDEVAGLSETGVDTKDVPVEEIDGVEAALKSDGKIKE